MRVTMNIITHFGHNMSATNECKVRTTYMLGYGANYVMFLPNNVIVLRFMDEYDLDFSVVADVEGIRSSCH